MRERGFKLKLIAAISVCVFSLIVLFTGSYAWFLGVKSLNSSTSPFPVQNITGAFKSLTIHELDKEKTAAASGIYKFKSIPTGTLTMDWANRDTDYEGSPVSFGMYRLIDQHQPVLFIYEFADELVASSDKPIKITAETDKTFLADGEVDEHGDLVIKIKNKDNPLTSIITYTSYAYPEDEENDSLTAIASYNTTDETFDYNQADVIANRDSFVKLNISGKNIEYDDFDNEVDFYEAPNGTHVRYIAVIMDYYYEALEVIYNYYLGSEVFDRDYVPYICDWETYI